MKLGQIIGLIVGGLGILGCLGILTFVTLTVIDDLKFPKPSMDELCKEIGFDKSLWYNSEDYCLKGDEATFVLKECEPRFLKEKICKARIISIGDVRIKSEG